MGHMIAFGLLSVLIGYLYGLIQSESEPAAIPFGFGLIISGFIAIVWAVVVLLARLIP